MKARRHIAAALAAGFALTATPVFAGGPVSKGPWIQRVGPTSAVVRVEVDPPAPVVVELGISGAGGPDGGGKKFESLEAKTLHAVTLTDLEPATRYTYTVRAHGAEKYAALTTAPRDDSAAPFRFLVYGDNRTDDAAHAAVVRAMTPVAADFLVHTGDFVTEGASARDWQAFFDIEAPLLRERCLFSCVGNHELIDGAGIEYVRYFGPVDAPPPADAGSARGLFGQPPRQALTPDMLNGTFRWSNARFFLFNGFVQLRSGATREWLERVLSEADNEKGLAWRIFVVHHGPWSSGPHGDNQFLAEARIPELLRRHKVDLVIAGHDHIYERGALDGLPYMVSGGGGAPTYKARARPFARKVESVRHFVEASVSQAAIQFVATRVDGTIIERCALRKEPAGWDCDKEVAQVQPAPAPSTPSSGVVPSTSRCGCRAAGAGGASPGSLAALTLLAALTVTRGALSRRRREVNERSGQGPRGAR